MKISETIVVQWCIILILGIASYLLTRNLKRIPNKKQVVLEALYSYAKGLVDNNMGESFTSYLPYVGTLVVYLMAMNLTGLIGIEPPTRDISVTAALGLTSFFIVNLTAMKRKGVWGYTKALGKPYILMLPLNILERVTLPISLALRLYGNMYAATLLIGLVYDALNSFALGIAQIGLPIIVHGYFDLFDGTIQMMVFTMLTIINIKITAEH